MISETIQQIEQETIKEKRNKSIQWWIDKKQSMKKNRNN